LLALVFALEQGQGQKPLQVSVLAYYLAYQKM
jgi:hypothetical protein